MGNENQRKMKKVITYGTYDLLHQGHINLLKRAKTLGDYLIVGVTNDNFDRERGKLNVKNNVLERVEAVRKTVLAPIIDPSMSKPLYKLLCKHYGCQKVGLTNRFHDLYLSAKYFDLFLARSQFEANYIGYCLDVPKDKIKIVPLSVRTPFADAIPKKEDFVLHISRLYAPNKNVKRLIEAAIKYNFQLRLGGVLNGEEEKRWLHNLIDGHDNIKYIGLLSEDDLVKWYARCKVFALPSLTEGVGMVALEAAAQGAEIVLTNDGAPKDYYQGRAYLVNPKSVDEIGQACLQALKGGKQPELLDFMHKHYTLEACTKQLIEALS